ncbi:MAG: 1-acyl-sn-glycerol-3-phosphate acyltransferase, partial [Rhodospirillales bacterium]|nr:1-acyl-sn-glycerol-3-phosphate acyltransferase [Rhodospirillales bacterium]
FSVAEKPVAGRPVMVQPVSMAYTKLDGMPLGVCWRPFVAWYGDMELAPHLWAVLGMGRLRVEVEFHAPVSFAAFGSRKAMADHCRKVVARGVSQALTGRDGAGEAGAGAVQTAIVSAG